MDRWTPQRQISDAHSMISSGNVISFYFKSFCQATGTGTGTGTWDLGFGTWDLGLGTWDLGPGT